ncbi:MAG: TatD family hydrolase [Theionarchaea archaeon]|nr:TatD family hydrolase [Theionarchaea archaeon]MBU7036375.1 TatD family hydrolase [Theionarchaea archaeon]
MTAITDNHMHLDRRGLFLDAVNQFKKAGGGRIILVQKPGFPQSVEEFVQQVEKTLAVCQAVRNIVECYAVVGLHPAEFDRLYNKGKEDVCYQALDVVESYVEKKKVVGMGEFGRPHYPVSAETYEASHEYMIQALKRSRELDCPIQLHTESLDSDGIASLDRLVKELGCTRVIKHFASPHPEYKSMIPSILATESNVTQAVTSRMEFLMETDYIDDPRRPGAVLGPKTVPKTTLKLVNTGTLTEDMVDRIHDQEVRTLYNL